MIKKAKEYLNFMEMVALYCREFYTPAEDYINEDNTDSQCKLHDTTVEDVNVIEHVIIDGEFNSVKDSNKLKSSVGEYNCVCGHIQSLHSKEHGCLQDKSCTCKEFIVIEFKQEEKKTFYGFRSYS